VILATVCAPAMAAAVDSAGGIGRATFAMRTVPAAGGDRSVDLPMQQSSRASKIGGDIVVDGGFEDGSPSGAWVESSSVFGSPIAFAVPGTADGSGARRGSWIAWFGGNGIDTDEAALSQAITVPTGAGPLAFFTQAPVCGAAGDVLDVEMDGNVVFEMTGTDATCGLIGYTRRSVDIDTWADGQTHTLMFTSHVTGVPADDLLSFSTTSFLVDDVSIQSPTSYVPVPALSWAGLVGLFALVSGTALGSRRGRKGPSRRA
jgi:hypothetical protein